MKNDNRVKESNSLVELFKNGLKKGELIELYFYTGKGTSIIYQRRNNG